MQGRTNLLSFKTNREEKLLNVDCQIRGKSDIQEALASMTEVEIMEGDNQVFCDQCKKNTDTVLRTAISTLPNVLILSLKRFDLDFTTFETVKLNSRCAFGQTLNMKEYTLDGLEAAEKEDFERGPDDMDIGTDDGATNRADEEYEYKLAGVLVHAGVAQGGHYYSFIKDRSPGSEERWYRFDDEDVTSFDPSAIETECFGGKVKKETKWPNGQVHTVESEQYANALMLFYEKVKPTETPPPSNDDETKVMKPILKDLAMSSGYDAFEPDVKKSNVTHQWQAFLFDTELQAFLKGLLGLCCMPANATEPWKTSVIDMLLTFFFDVLLYSNERPALGEWTRMLEDITRSDKACARVFVAKLASTTKAASANLLRTYLSECPDPPARNAAVRIFTTAFLSCLEVESDEEALRKWTVAWASQCAAIVNFNDAFPCSLEGDWYRYEDPESNDYSPLGAILSFLNVLIEASTRNWRYVPELNTFVRNLAMKGTDLLRSALVESLIPARLVCTIVKNFAPPHLRAAFPGASVTSDVAVSQMRPEANHSPQVMSMGGSHVMNSNDPNYNRGGAPPPDFLTLFEALGCLLGIQGIVHVPLVVEFDDPARCHHITLNDQTVSALRQLFDECCAHGASGMDRLHIEAYLQKCGIDPVNLPGPKIDELVAKFPTTGGNHLSLDGFLAYYQDMVQTNELRVRSCEFILWLSPSRVDTVLTFRCFISQVRSDLHTHGFRPDLSRRPLETRFISVDGRKRTLSTVESVVRDVTLSVGLRVPSLGKLADLGLCTFQFYVGAFSTSEIVSEHLLSAAVWRIDQGHLLVSSLRAINQTPTGWVGNETLNSAIMVLRVMSAVNDDRQSDRINLMMKCTEPAAPNADYGIGLLVASRAFFAARQAHTNYPNEISYAYERYVGILKELLALQSVYHWMSENSSLWAFMNSDVLDTAHRPQQHVRSDESGQRDRGIPGVPVGHHAPSDSDGVPGMHDSEDDEDSRFEDMETYDHGPRKITVEGAGNPAVNGVYVRDGFFERASKFSRRGEYEGMACNFFLFQCNVSNNTKHWYLSIVPNGTDAGTSSDTDFYSAPVNEMCIEFPPHSGWTKSNEGIDPPPILTYHDIAPMDDSDVQRVPGPSGWDKGDQAPHHQMQTYGNM
jgi:ubiquitin carboxyl-terminal hydrolase 9/24